MNKFLFIFFIVIFGTFVLFSRHPDYFDGQRTPAVIHFLRDSASQKIVPKAIFTLNGKDSFAVNAAYLFRHFTDGEHVSVIYENADPQNAAVYSFWGYWITWKELLGCLVGYFVLFQAALAITSNPSQESIQELEDYAKKPKVKKRRYK